MNVHSSIIAGDGDDKFRASVVGASEVAALFDASPYLTKFELWHRKAGTIDTPTFSSNERMEWGVRLEPVIVEAARERWGYERSITPKRLDNGKGLGGHPDRVLNCPERGRGVLEIKTADWIVAKKWGDEPPLHYLLQSQVYQGLLGVTWGDVVVLIGGNEMRRFQYEFRPAIFAEVERRVEDFWSSIRANDPPPPDFHRDGDVLAQVLGAPTEDLIDLRHDNEADELAARYLDWKAAAKTAEAEAEAVKTQLLLKMGSAGVALMNGHKITATQTKGSPDRTITQEMVGDIIKGRRGYRTFNVRETQ